MTTTQSILETSLRWLNGPCDNKTGVFTRIIKHDGTDFDKEIRKFICEYAKYCTWARIKKPFWVKHVDTGEWYKVRLSTEQTFWVDSMEKQDESKSKKAKTKAA